MPFEFPPDDVLFPQLAERNLMVAGIALVGSCGGAFPSDADGLRELLRRAREKVASGMEDLSMEVLLSDEEQKTQPDHELKAKPDVWVSIGEAGALELMAMYPTGRYRSAEIRPDGVLVSHGFGALG
jgi:hypothetical protein